ncbi:MAG: hypothetical protein Cons2KO_17240 [Congregibacter sp.]
MGIWLWAALGLLVSACSTQPDSTAKPIAVGGPEPVGQVELQLGGFAQPALDIAVLVFDQGLGRQSSDARVYPTVRKAESLLLPVRLAQTLQDSAAWGVVRVVHNSDVYMALSLETEILRADGADLHLATTLRSAAGQVLLQREYRDVASETDYPVTLGSDPFDDIYRAIANDVRDAVAALEAGQRRNLERLALMRFAASLSPSAFSRFVVQQGDRYELQSFPADNDPMLRRLDRLRRQDDLFVDAVDQRYRELYEEVRESYALWREFSFELQRFGDEYRASAAERKRTARRGSYAAMQQVYASFRKVKIQEEDLGDIVDGFAGESLETVLEVDDGVVRLSGSVEERYAEWRRILGRIVTLETGELDPSAP